MNLRHAQYIITIIKEGSITAAAKKLYISQPSLSQIVKAAESNLGTPILERSTDPISLTYAGERYVETAEKILSLNQNLLREVAEIASEDHGSFTLGIPVQRAMQILPKYIPTFLEMYRNVTVNIEEHGSATIEKMLLSGQIDIACFTTTPTHKAIKYIPVKKEEVVLLASSESTLAKRIAPGTTLAISDLKDECFISIKSGHSVRKIQEILFAKYDINPSIYLETTSIEVGKRVAVNSDAVMFCPKDYIEMTPDVLQNAAIYPLGDAHFNRAFYIAHKQDLYITKYMTDFINLLCEGQ